VQLAAPGPLTLSGAQLRLLNCNTATRFTWAARLWPFQEPVIVTVCVVSTVPARAVNVALLVPAATVTLDGTGSCVALLVNATPAGLVAGFDKVTVHVTVCPLLTEAGEQLIPDNWAGDVKLSVALRVTPFALAVIAPVWSVVTFETSAVNVTAVAPAGTVTPAGTVMLALLSEIETGYPPAGAGALRVTVQVEAPGAITVDGEQVNPLNVTVTVRLIWAVAVWPFQEAVTVADCAELMVPAVAVKVAVLDPAATATLAGTLSWARLLDRFTVVLLAAAFERATVQVEV
jgi:hypothetical protein